MSRTGDVNFKTDSDYPDNLCLPSPELTGPTCHHRYRSSADLTPVDLPTRTQSVLCLFTCAILYPSAGYRFTCQSPRFRTRPRYPRSSPELSPVVPPRVCARLEHFPRQIADERLSTFRNHMLEELGVRRGSTRFRLSCRSG